MMRNPHVLGEWGARCPLDPSDFGRCYRLLKAFPDWRARISEVGALYPRWVPFSREWERMTVLFEKEVQRSDGMAPELYEVMKSLERETAQ